MEHQAAVIVAIFGLLWYS